MSDWYNEMQDSLQNEESDRVLPGPNYSIKDGIHLDDKIIMPASSMEEHGSPKAEVGGSTPPQATNKAMDPGDLEGLQDRLDEALKFIMDVGLELVENGYPPGDRTVIMANLRSALKELRRKRVILSRTSDR